MRLLLDTHVLLWWLADDERLAAETAAAIEDGRNEVLVSAASVWEVEIKRAKGTLKAPDDLLEQLAGAGFSPLAIDPAHARDAARLPRRHEDPFDRMLIAQALAEGATLVSSDAAISRYQVPILSAG